MTSDHVQHLQLVLTANNWEPAIRRLLIEPRLWALGSLRWNETSRVSYLLVDNLTVDENVPSGQSRPPLSDWLAVRVVDGDPQAYLRDAIEDVLVDPDWATVNSPCMSEKRALHLPRKFWTHKSYFGPRSHL